MTSQKVRFTDKEGIDQLGNLIELLEKQHRSIEQKTRQVTGGVQETIKAHEAAQKLSGEMKKLSDETIVACQGAKLEIAAFSRLARESQAAIEILVEKFGGKAPVESSETNINPLHADMSAIGGRPTNRDDLTGDTHEKESVRRTTGDAARAIPGTTDMNEHLERQQIEESKKAVEVLMTGMEIMKDELAIAVSKIQKNEESVLIKINSLEERNISHFKSTLDNLNERLVLMDQEFQKERKCVTRHHRLVSGVLSGIVIVLGLICGAFMIGAL